MILLKLYHYYELDNGPFKNLSSLGINEAEEVLEKLRDKGDIFASKRSNDYLKIRRDLENQAKTLFTSKGGKPQNNYPHYMTLGACEWIRNWYKDGRYIEINLEEFNKDSISFTYGDLFPTMRYKDDREYRGQVYTKNEIFELINKYGLPQEWNKDGTNGPERYIEVQVWDNEVIKKYICK